jgi:hypothetical protein
MYKSTVMLLAALATAGCASTPTHWIRRLPNGDQYLVTGCEYPEKCRATPGVRLTSDPADEEAWKYETQVLIRGGFGIPYGRTAVDRIVVGAQEQCEQVREREEARGTTTQPCQGPLRFRFVE